MLTVRGLGALAAPHGRQAEMRGFASAALRNLVSRERLAGMLERVVMGDARGGAAWLRERFDGFTTHFAALSQRQPGAGAAGVRQPAAGDAAGARAGRRAARPLLGRRHHRLPPGAAVFAAGQGDLVLYPHFSEHIVPGWLDKAMPWRRAARGPRRGWLDNVIIVAPTRRVPAQPAARQTAGPQGLHLLRRSTTTSASPTGSARSAKGSACATSSPHSPPLRTSRASSRSEWQTKAGAGPIGISIPGL